MLLVQLLVNSRLLVVTLWGSHSLCRSLTGRHPSPWHSTEILLVEMTGMLLGRAKTFRSRGDCISLSEGVKWEWPVWRRVRGLLWQSVKSRPVTSRMCAYGAIWKGPAKHILSVLILQAGKCQEWVPVGEKYDHSFVLSNPGCEVEN